MAILCDRSIRDRDDIARFESAMPLEQRLPERSVVEVVVGQAARQGDRTALTMLMTGAPDETPRRVGYRELLGLVRRAANLFATLGGTRRGVAYMLPSVAETHATLWGAETAGYAVPINFLLQPEHVEALIRASGAQILGALGPHPALDIWSKALALRESLPGLKLVRVAHTHRSQLVAALGGAALSDMRPADTLTATLPLFHVGGTILCSLSAFKAGVELLVMSPSGLRNPAMVQGFWRLVARYGATLIGGVPTSAGAVLEVPIGYVDLEKVRAGFCGAASLPLAVGERFRTVTRRGLFEVYGMTEASGLIAIDPVGGNGGVGSVGWPLPYTRVEVRRLEANGRLGATCETNEIGVITVRGANVSPGYRKPEHDAGVFDDGVLNPLMIENAMATHPAVALAAAACGSR